MSSVRNACILHHVPMQLKDIIGVDRDQIMVFMDGVQHLSVPHDLAFVPVARCGFIGQQLLHAGIGRYDALDLIGSLCALYSGNLHQTIQFCRFLAHIKLLSAFAFMDLCHIRERFHIPHPVCQLSVVKASHTVFPPSCCGSFVS